MIITLNKITNFSIKCKCGNNSRTRFPSRVSSVTVVIIHDVGSHERNTQIWNTIADHDILRIRYQRMNIKIIKLSYLKG